MTINNHDLAHWVSGTDSPDADKCREMAAELLGRRVSSQRDGLEEAAKIVEGMIEWEVEIVDGYARDVPRSERDVAFLDAAAAIREAKEKP